MLFPLNGFPDHPKRMTISMIPPPKRKNAISQTLNAGPMILMMISVEAKSRVEPNMSTEALRGEGEKGALEGAEIREFAGIIFASVIRGPFLWIEV